MQREAAPVFFLTASEAYPALEKAFLEAKTEVLGSFRVFDPETKLRSEAGLKIGDTWADLMRHVVGKGVKVTLRISDFDPIVGTELHSGTHASVRGFREAVGETDLFDVRPALHTAQMGIFPRLMLWPRTYIELRRHAAKLRDMTEPERNAALRDVPGLRKMMRGETAHLRARAFPPPTVHPATHHQKLAIFDGKKLYVGGLDLDERRYDTLVHDQSGDQTWHDVQVMMTGAPAKAAHDYLTAFVADDFEALRAPFPGLLRTYSEQRRFRALYLSPRPVLNEIEQAHMVGFKRARRLIYLETQFFRDTKLADKLCKAGRANSELQVIIVLPAAPDDLAFENSKGSDVRYGEYLQAKCLDQLKQTFGERLFIAATAQPRRTTDTARAQLDGAPLIYVHAKVSVFDDDTAIISSANLNGRSMKWDTEAGVLLDNADDVARLRERCFEHWYGGEAPAEFKDPATAVATWRALADANQAKVPEERTGFILPYSTSPARKLGRNLPGAPEELV
ncbi:phospholipase D-like domain-containing protein [Litoreibacter albidus]|uniref:Phospholipase D n=1 Tax=Litoreibacter albidus TaxID=670155 RepID=A0A1H3BVM7_9RHOB|nr:phospholipase D-like domain-containing protein [Litoreibacter albidus]SDX45209.1 phospholipase D1/2 [Litoreibacter albidus]